MDAVTTFYYHKVDEETQLRMNEARKRFIELASYIKSLQMEPRSLADRSISLAITELEYSQMRVIQALALQHGTLIDPFVM